MIDVLCVAKSYNSMILTLQRIEILCTIMADKAQINRSLNTIRTELEYLRDAGILAPPQFNSIAAQLPVRRPFPSCRSGLLTVVNHATKPLLTSARAVSNQMGLQVSMSTHIITTTEHRLLIIRDRCV